jgi:uncharacterized damage-inducible protein DinB
VSIAAVTTPPQTRAAERAPETFALVALLEQLRDVITSLPASVYRAQPAARVSGSVGEHIRHTLDHVSALIAALEGDLLSYDRRVRGTLTETDPLTAVNEIGRVLFRIDRLTARALDRTVTLSVLIDTAAPPALVGSTLARELAFVIQHTIHHCALIALLLDWQGWVVPHGFGGAPSTARARADAH